MYLSVYLFKNKSTGPHEVDFVIGNRRDWLQNLMSQRGGVIRERGRGGGAYYKNRLPNGGLVREGRGGNRERGFIELLR